MYNENKSTCTIFVSSGKEKKCRLLNKLRLHLTELLNKFFPGVFPYFEIRFQSFIFESVH